MISLGDTGWLTAEIGVGIVVAIVVKVSVFHDISRRALRRTQRSYAARARRLAGLALAAFDEPGPRASRRLYRYKTRLGEATQLIDGQLADPGVAQADSAAALLHQRLFDSWLALGNLARFAAALGRSPLRAGQREQVREILASGDGRLALRDLRLIDGALAELAGALGLHVTSYDIGPADDHVRSTTAPDPAGEPASSQSGAADGGEPDR